MTDVNICNTETSTSVFREECLAPFLGRYREQARVVKQTFDSCLAGSKNRPTFTRNPEGQKDGGRRGEVESQKGGRWSKHAVNTTEQKVTI